MDGIEEEEVVSYLLQAVSYFKIYASRIDPQKIGR
jgi:hypothetical protein